MATVDTDALKKRILKKLGIRDETYLLASEKSIFDCIDEEEAENGAQIRKEETSWSCVSS